tara:strand:+ start:505 stop:684 length:180 start_codon:yes stop_codon:yes gene_type:complete
MTTLFIYQLYTRMVTDSASHFASLWSHSAYSEGPIVAKIEVFEYSWSANSNDSSFIVLG